MAKSFHFSKAMGALSPLRSGHAVSKWDQRRGSRLPFISTLVAKYRSVSQITEPWNTPAIR